MPTPPPSPKGPKGPKNIKKLPIKPLVKAPKGKGPIMRTLPIDDQIYRTLPITEKQLGTIKKMYGI